MRICPSDQPTQATQMTKPLLLTLEISHKMFIGDWNRVIMPNAAATWGTKAAFAIYSCHTLDVRP